MRDRTLTPATYRVRGAPHYRPQAVQQATIEQPQVNRRFDVRSTCPQRGPVQVYPCWMRHCLCSHAKLELVRLDTSRSPVNRLPRASPHSAARTNSEPVSNVRRHIEMGPRSGGIDCPECITSTGRERYVAAEEQDSAIPEGVGLPAALSTDMPRKHIGHNHGAVMTTTTVPSHTSVEDRRAIGERARDNTPISAQVDWEPAAGRPDPVELLIDQNATREPDLVPVRHGRMTVSPFTFYRGAAKIMATDLATTPMAGLVVQLCGDAHLSNFGGFASPERQLLFGLNDFDETLPGPFEYDLKRMAASFTIAARNNGFSPADARAVTIESVKAYRLGMAEFAAMRTMDVWYAHMTEHDIQDGMRAVQEASNASTKSSKGKTGKKKQGRSKASKADAMTAKAIKNANRALRKAHTRDSLGALTKFAEVVDGRHRIVSHPPVIIPLRDIAASYEMTPDQARNAIEEQFQVYKASLNNDRRQLLDRFTIVDAARKVVGVGSVGTRAWMVLLQGRDNADPLFLQVKEATASVLEDHLPKSRYDTPGQRVVEGQRLMQAASDIFLGWTRGVQANRYYYWRQLRDMKGSAVVETMTPVAMTFYAQICGWTLARAHARSGDPIAIAEYLGMDDAVGNAIADFSARYADQNQRDYDTFVKAIADGRIQAVSGV
jgi:uncharacterized protein (DUF2252 family)